MGAGPENGFLCVSVMCAPIKVSSTVHLKHQINLFPSAQLSVVHLLLQLCLLKLILHHVVVWDHYSHESIAFSSGLLTGQNSWDIQFITNMLIIEK